MHKTVAESQAIATEIARRLPAGDTPRVGLFPNLISLAAVAQAVEGAAHHVTVGAQNIHWERRGAFTGETAAEMVLGGGGEATLVGHSERRHVFGETDAETAKKVARALDAGLEPILCVGETLDEREAGRTTDVVQRQLSAGLEEIKVAADLSRVVIAYEPVWAIGTGKTATPAQGQEVHEFIRGHLQGQFERLGGSGEEVQQTLILYGGSVKPENSGELLAEKDVDGLLVGGASLEADSFLAICESSF